MAKILTDFQKICFLGPLWGQFLKKYPLECLLHAILIQIMSLMNKFHVKMRSIFMLNSYNSLKNNAILEVCVLKYFKRHKNLKIMLKLIFSNNCRSVHTSPLLCLLVFYNYYAFYCPQHTENTQVIWKFVHKRHNLDQNCM